MPPRRRLALVAIAFLLTGAGPPAPTRFLDTAEGRLAYDDTGGGGPLVIAVPGMGDVRQEYRFLTPWLKDAGYRIVTVDLRGFGGSDAGWRDYSARAVAGDLLRLEACLGQTKAVFVGNSYTAGAAIWAAHDAPLRTSAIVLLAPVVRDPPASPPWLARTVMRLMFASPWRVRFWLQYWDSLFPLRRPPDQAAYRLALGQDLRQPGRMAALAAMVHLSKAPTTAILREVSAPALLVMGSRDPEVDDPVAEATWISRQTGARLSIIPGAGHYPHVDTPDQVGPVVVAFLRTLSR